MRDICYLLLILISIVPSSIFSQSTNSYNVEVNLNSDSKIVHVKQKMKFRNNSTRLLKELYLEDWSNAYINNKTKLAKRISDEYSRSFSFAKKSQRGSTTIKHILSENILSWERVENESDIIRVILKEPLKTGESIEIDIDYSIKLPDSKFTGYGFDDSNFYLKNWLIVFSNYTNSKWSNQSNLNLDDQSLAPSSYNLNFSFDKDYMIVSNLVEKDTRLKNNIKSVKLNGSKIKNVKINLLLNNNFKVIRNEKIIVETDIFKNSSDLESEIKFNRVVNYLNNYFNNSHNLKFLVSNSDYKSSPFYGLNQLPSFISPFSDKFLEEIIFLKSFTQNYINEKLNLNKREHHWIYNGLEIFIINKYINKFYPNVKFLGRLSSLKLIKNYEISNLDFNDIFLNYSEYFQRLNLHQSDSKPSDYLTRINKEIISPYHSGVGLIYIEKIIGSDNFKNLMSSIGQIYSTKDLNNLFLNYSEYDLSWFINHYIGKRESFDLKIKKINKNEIKVFEKNNIKIPYYLGYIKNDSVVYSKMFKTYKNIKIPKIDFDYIAINPEIKLPESNRLNNWLYSKSKAKPLRLRLIGDLESPKYKSLFLRPEITYNLYDGISPGVNFLNKGIKNRPFSYEVFTQYSSNEQTLIGSLNLRYQINNETENNYSSIFNLIYTTNHYNENLRYQVFSPSILIKYRDNTNLRSNIKKSISLSMFNVNKQNNINTENSLDKYSVFNLGYYYSDVGIIKYLKSSINSEFSDYFGKINFVFDYRKLLNSNRQIQARVYLGKFFWNSDKFNNFQYNLGRSGGYLFLNNYLGRSEESGLLSQQFIMAGGGFKSFFENPSTNNFMLTSNINIGIWKWIEGYLDLGLLKNKNEKSRYFYGSGLRLNLLPDFFELYFPVSSSNGLELDDYRYYNKIRFIVSYNLESLGKLFSRRWF